LSKIRHSLLRFVAWKLPSTECLREVTTLSKSAQRLTSQQLLLNGIVHSYGNARAVDDVTLEVKAGELVALLGPSGCGKTTLLRIVAGFIRQASGQVMIGDRAVDDLPPNLREVGIVFQSYALFPHMTVAENIAYGLVARGVGKAEQRARVAEMLATVRMEGFMDRKPRQLSGGQQQRIALARALAVQPRILLLDEPFAALDKNLRLDMQIEIKRLQRQFGLTAILVTHDQEEAMSIADRIAVMNGGRIEQLGTPVAIYDEPATPFVNSFIGSSNILDGIVEDVGIRLAVGAILPCPTQNLPQGKPVQVSIRPEQLMLVREAAPDRFPVTLMLSLPIGGQLIHDAAAMDGSTLKIATARHPGDASSLLGAWHCALTPEARPSIFPLSTP
jgi:putative spermidine/putrescine transport system ATP-binding protein